MGFTKVYWGQHREANKLLRRLWKNRAKYIGSEDGFLATAAAIASLVGTGMSLFGGGDEYEQPAYQPPQWLQEAQKQAWGEISAPAKSYPIPQSFITRGMGDIEKKFALAQQKGTYGFNIRNLLESGIYKQQYLPRLAEQEAEAVGTFQSAIDMENAMRQAQSEQERLRLMSQYIGQGQQGYQQQYGLQAGTAWDAYRSAMQGAEQYGGMGETLGKSLGGVDWSRLLGRKPQTSFIKYGGQAREVPIAPKDYYLTRR